MNPSYFPFECLCTFGGVTVGCTTDAIRAVDDESDQVTEVALTPSLVTSHRQVALNTPTPTTACASSSRSTRWSVPAAGG